MNWKHLSCFVIVLLALAQISQSQQVDCLKQIQSSYGYPVSCFSTSTDTRPINATAFVKCSRNTTWYGPDDWTPFIARGQYLVYDLYAQSNCYMIEPNKGTIVSGRTYEFSAKCTFLSFDLLKGDVVYFDLFESTKHAKAQCAFAIPIPGYSEPSDANFSQETLAGFKKQAQQFRSKRISKENLRQQQAIMIQ